MCSLYLHCIPHSQLQTIHEGVAGDDSEDASSDSEDGSSEGEGKSEDDMPPTSTDNVITIYIDDSSKEIATQTDPSELGSSCKCDLVLQKLDQVLEAVELISSEMGVTTSDVYDIKQRCKAMENQFFLMVCYNRTCTSVCSHFYNHLYATLQRSRPPPSLTSRVAHMHHGS